MPIDAVAVAVVCKAPVAGACKTRLCPPLTALEAARLSQCFITDTARLIEATAPGRGVAVYTPAGSEAEVARLLPTGFGMLAQRGVDLTERLSNAVFDLFQAGYVGVCLMGSDSPTLPRAILRRAVGALRTPGDRVVLGPAIDGGYCLVGLTRPHPELFTGVTWSSGQVLTQTLARVADLGLPLTLLPPWYDVDDLDSLRLLLHELFGGGDPLARDGDRDPEAAPCTRRLLEAWRRAPEGPRLGFPDPVAAGERD